ncbi:flagellar filament capping protein FliD [Frateuria defendens]|uniref:flagellar filament capping protein FliD n=1 Tax=Frateuria defendens TaxID=2219559 RepID=UPI0009E5D9C6|nr:flagellar filament capping protein FliD [Frateuria defendens]
MTSVSATGSSVPATSSSQATTSGSASSGSTTDSSGASSATGSTGSTGSTSTGSGTGLLSSAGIGSGLNVDAIVTAMVNARQAGPQAQIDAKTKQDQALIAGLTALGSSLGSLQSALDKLSASTTYQTYTATFSDSTVAAATTLPNAIPGTYNIDVTALATAQKRTSSVFASGAAVGSGTLSIAVGGKTLDLAVSGTDTLSSLATAINNSSDNPGVSAAVINGSNGSQLVLTSTRTGVANAFTVSASGDSSSSLAGLATSLNTAGGNEASDAKLTIDGIPVSSSGNAVSGALNGVTLNLTKVGSAQLTVAQDTSAVSDAVQGFVDAYNGYAGMVGTLSSYDPSTGTAGVLLGDTTLSSIQRQVSSVLSSKVGGNAIGTLASLGITRTADGTLSVDAGKLNAALSGNPSAVQDLFAGPDGYATRLDSALDHYTGSSGIVQTRIGSLNDALTGLQKQTTALNQRMQVYEAQLRQQYTNLDKLISSLNNTSSYLTQSLEALNKSKSGS